MKKKISKGYKVVWVQPNGVKCSAVMNNLACVIYKRKVWTRRKIDYGPYAIFNNLPAASLFLLQNCRPTNQFRIYVCEYQHSEDTIMYSSDPHTFGFEYMALSSTPRGTVLADKVRILTIAK